MYDLWKQLQTGEDKNMKECNMESCRSNVYYGGRHLCLHSHPDETCPYYKALRNLETLKHEILVLRGSKEVKK